MNSYNFSICYSDSKSQNDNLRDLHLLTECDNSHADGTARSPGMSTELDYLGFPTKAPDCFALNTLSA